MASTDPQQQQQQQQQFLQIAQHDKFYSKVFSKETSLANPSFRMYYGRASVPFVWESQPGTPKRYSMDPTAPLPPLPPPPSYHLSNPKRKKPTSKSNLIHCLKRNSDTTTSSTNTCTASLSSSSSSSSSSGSHGRRYTSPSRSSLSSKAEDDDSADEGSSPKSTLRAGCYSMLLLKNILLSIVSGGGQGPSDRDASS